MSKNKHTASSTRWLNEHFEDEYVKKAKKLGLRSRAVFKIEEINNKDKLIKSIPLNLVSYLIKPVDYDELTATLNDVVDRISSQKLFEDIACKNFVCVNF